MSSLIKVTLVKSTSNCDPRQLATVKGLGLERIGRSKILKDSAPIRGMVMKVQHLIEVERFDGDDSLRQSARLKKKKKAQA